MRTWILFLALPLHHVNAEPDAACRAREAKLGRLLEEIAATVLDGRERCPPGIPPSVCDSVCSNLVEELRALRAKSASDDESLAELRRQMTAYERLLERKGTTPLHGPLPGGGASLPRVAEQAVQRPTVESVAPIAMVAATRDSASRRRQTPLGEECEEAVLTFESNHTCAPYASGQRYYASRAASIINAKIIVAEPPFACTNLTNAEGVVGKVVIIDRGACTFAVKAANAFAAGAVAIVIANTGTQSEVAGMAGDFSLITVPVLGLVTRETGSMLKALAGRVVVTLRTGASFGCGLGVPSTCHASANPLSAPSMPRCAGVRPKCSQLDERIMSFLGAERRLDNRQSMVRLLHEGMPMPNLTSPYGLVSSGKYGDDAKCSWAIAPPGATNVTLNFKSFDLETDYDFLQVYDGLGEHATLLANLTGQRNPQPVTSTTGTMLIVLKSDEVTTANGFEATYRAGNAPAAAVPTVELGSDVCTPSAQVIDISAACRMCVISTVASVCGDTCITDVLHITTETNLALPPPSLCLPALGRQLATAQAAKLLRLLTNSEPVGLSFSTMALPAAEAVRISDLYLPTAELPLFDQKVYVGLDTRYYLFSCDPADHPHVWAISAAKDRAKWRRCEGMAVIDLASGQAHSAVTDAHALSIPIMVSGDFGECKAVFQSQLNTSAGRIRFDPSTSSSTMACWLARFYGPQAAKNSVLPPTVIELASNYAPIRLVSDLVVRAGQKLTILGNGNTLIVSERQIRVHADGWLAMELLTIAESAHSSAVLVEGIASFRNSTIRDCTALLNVLTATDGLQSRGAGIYAANGSRVELFGSVLLQNCAKNVSSKHSLGGGAYATGKAAVYISDTKINRNQAGSGGGLCVHDGPSVDVVRTEFSGNLAILMGGGIQVLRARSVRLFSLAMRNNTAYVGGAIGLQQLAMADVSGTQMLNNTANVGGAISVVDQAHLKLVGSIVGGNTACKGGGGIHIFGQSSADLIGTMVVGNRVPANETADGHFGGGILVTDRGSLTLVGSSLNQNVVSATSGSSSWGGALAVVLKSTVEVSDSELLDNVVGPSGQFSRGGGVVVHGGSNLTLVRVHMLRNAALHGMEASEGGSLHVDGSSATIIESYINESSAEQGVKAARGGAISVIAPSLLDLRWSQVLNSAASTTAGSAFGGAIFAASGGSLITISDSGITGSRAVTGNAVGGEAAGGAIFVGSAVSLMLADSRIHAAHAQGASAKGGAISFGGSSLELKNVSVTRSRASAWGVDGSALGGALFHEGSLAQLAGCRLVENQAIITSPAIRASGGALYVDSAASATMVGCLLRHNAAGGQGKYELYVDYAEALADERESSAMHIFSKGNVILDSCDVTDELGQQAIRSWYTTRWWWIVVDGGTLILRHSQFVTSAKFDPCLGANSGQCDVPQYCPAGDYTDCNTTAPADAPGFFFDPCSFAWDGKCDSGPCPTSDWIDCQRPPPPAAGPYGKLLTVRSRLAEVVLRGCNVSMLTINSVTKLGVVNSNFHPPIDLFAAPTVTPAPDCGVVVAGAYICDPRALCKAAPSGGVQCACIGEGLRFKPGVPADGQQCEQETRVSMLTQSQKMSVIVRKPSNQTNTVQVVLQAIGESPFNTSYGISMERIPAAADKNSSAQQWNHLEQMQFLLDGHHIVWKLLPADQFKLGKDRFSITRLYSFDIVLDCTAGESCVEDGDTVETVVQTGALSSPPGMQSQVLIVTQVQSIVSCDRSEAWIQRERSSERLESLTVGNSFPIIVHVDVRDVDHLPISHHQIGIEFSWNGAKFAHVWGGKGSSSYVATLPPSLIADGGQYELIVTALDGFKQGVGHVPECVLLRTLIYVDSDNTQFYIAAGLVVLLVLCIAFLGFVLVRKREQSKHLLLSFLSFEGILLLEAMFELWDVITDGFFVWDIWQFRSRDRVRQLIVPYLVFFVLSCIVSVVSIVVKAMLFFTKIRTRDIAHKIGKRRATIGGVDISSELSDNEAVKELKARFDEHRMEQRRYYCYILQGLFEDLPIGILNLVYLVRTVQECADTGADRICDLNPTKTTMLVLGTLTSAGMLGFKAAHVEVIRMKWEEHKRLQRERAELLAALEASLSPELTLTVKQIFDQQDFERNTIRDGDLNGAVEELIRHRRATSVATQRPGVSFYEMRQRGTLGSTSQDTDAESVASSELPNLPGGDWGPSTSSHAVKRSLYTEVDSALDRNLAALLTTP